MNYHKISPKQTKNSQKNAKQKTKKFPKNDIKKFQTFPALMDRKPVSTLHCTSAVLFRKVGGT
jgi:hypothetical protein